MRVGRHSTNLADPSHGLSQSALCFLKRRAEEINELALPIKLAPNAFARGLNGLNVRHQRLQNCIIFPLRLGSINLTVMLSRAELVRPPLLNT